jgi:hypothetical protein
MSNIIYVQEKLEAAMSLIISQVSQLEIERSGTYVHIYFSRRPRPSGEETRRNS